MFLEWGLFGFILCHLDFSDLNFHFLVTLNSREHIFSINYMFISMLINNMVALY